MEIVRSTDKRLPETIATHCLNACLNMPGEQEEQMVQGLVRELEAALTTLSGKNTVIEELNREVESLRSLVKRLEQRNSQLEYKDSSTIDPERYFHYQELCDSLVRYGDILHILCENIDMSNKKSTLIAFDYYRCLNFSIIDIILSVLVLQMLTSISGINVICYFQ